MAAPIKLNITKITSPDGAATKTARDTQKKMASESPVDPSLLEWAEYWYPISWKGLLVAGVLAAVSACATVGFFVLQWRTTTIKERHADWRTVSLENDAAQARLEQERLKASVAWRRLTKEQHDIIVASLKGQKFDIWVGTVGNDPEAVLFWEDVTKALGTAGLNVKPFTGYARALGLGITHADGPEREAIVSAFTFAGLSLSEARGDSVSHGKLEIVVGSKPPAF